MIKISKYIYIHPISILLFIICYMTRRLEMLICCYLIMTVHELSHLIAALSIGLIPSRIVIYPFGLNLKLKNKMVYSLADEIILYLAGPLSNICMAVLTLPFINKGIIFYNLYIQNIALFLFNMLPVLPLDGGIVAKKILSYWWGNKIAVRILRIISFIIVASFTSVGVYLAVLNNFNYSICFLIIFLVCNIFTADEKYNIDFVRELLFYKEKGRKYNNQKVKVILMEEESDLKRVAQNFSTRSFYIVFAIDKKGRIAKILTETEVMESITTNKKMPH